MSTTSQNLRSALDLFGPNGKNWIRGCLQLGADCYCAVGAVCKVLYDDSEGTDPGNGFKTAYLSIPEFQALHQAIAEIDGSQWITSFRWDPAAGVAEFNDEQTDFTMVERAFKRAIEIAEEAGK